MVEQPSEERIITLCRLCEHRFPAPGHWPRDREGYTCSRKALGLIDCTESSFSHFSPKIGVTPDQIRPLVTALALHGMLIHNSNRPDWKTWADGYYKTLTR